LKNIINEIIKKQLINEKMCEMPKNASKLLCKFVGGNSLIPYLFYLQEIYRTLGTKQFQEIQGEEPHRFVDLVRATIIK
jgi:hypothetical protein